MAVLTKWDCFDVSSFFNSLYAFDPLVLLLLRGGGHPVDGVLAYKKKK